MIYKRIAGFLRKICRKKTLDEDYLKTDLHRCLGIKDLTVLGISGMLGAGLYVLTGTVAKNTSGPAVMVSYAIASAAAFLSALCYAEFGSRIPTTGSSYIFTYVTMGEFWGFLMGWNMILEHGVGSASVAKAWSGYLDAAMGNPVQIFFQSHLSLGHNHPLSEYPDLIAIAIILILSGLVAIGAESSAKFNLLFTVINMVVVLFIIITGFCLADVRNWVNNGNSFWHFGFAGVISGASRCFFAFAGFDIIASSCEEARNPRRDVPIALGISLITVTLSYVGVSAVLTLMVPWNEIVPESAFSQAYARNNWRWAEIFITCGALCTMTTSMFSGLYVLPRILYAIAKDGLLCPALAKINNKTQVPLWSVAFTACLCGGMAMMFDLETLVQFMSIGTLASYSFVAACVILLRYGAVGDSPLVQLSNQNSSAAKNLTNEKSSQISQDDCQDENKSKNENELESPRAFGETSLLITSSSHEQPTIQHPGQIRLTSGGRKVRLKTFFQGGHLQRFLDQYHSDDVILISLIFSTIFSTTGMLLIAYDLDALSSGAVWSWLLLLMSLVGAISFLLIIHFHDQHQSSENIETKTFKVPFVPFLPYLCICVNIFLMIKLEAMTWFRLIIWITVGICVYFLYGYHNSLLNTSRDCDSWLFTIWNRLVGCSSSKDQGLVESSPHVITKIKRKSSMEQKLLSSNEDLENETSENKD